MAEPNWKPCVHSVQPRLVYLPPTVKTGAPLAGAQDCSRERILAAERANRRRSLGARASRVGADCVSTIAGNFSLSAEPQPGYRLTCRSTSPGSWCCSGVRPGRLAVVPLLCGPGPAGEKSPTQLPKPPTIHPIHSCVTKLAAGVKIDSKAEARSADKKASEDLCGRWSISVGSCVRGCSPRWRGGGKAGWQTRVWSNCWIYR